MGKFLFLSEKSIFYGCLASQHGLGYAGFARLLARFGSPEAVYAATPETWKEAWPRLSAPMSASLARGPRFEEWQALVHRCEKDEISLRAPVWPGYPEPLAILEAPPPLLYLRGEWMPQDARAVAIVGTRTPTAYGREVAITLARDLAAQGFTIVSGLALGIDGAAHAGALAGAPSGAVEGTGRTLAVIGCGLDIPYPIENLEVRRRIEADSGKYGAVISEFPPGTQPLPAYFPRRNRLISALSRATIVVEAGVPGPIFSSVSSGTNALLRKGALLAASAEDIIRVLDGADRGSATRSFQAASYVASQNDSHTFSRTGSRATSPQRSRSFTTAAATPEDPVLRLWGADSVCGLDALAARAREQGLWPDLLDAPEAQVGARLLEALLRLEMSGKVSRLPGAAYRIIGAV